MERFIKELKAAKRRGVDVDSVFVENKVREMEATLFMGVRILALACSVLGVFLGPVCVIAAQIYIAEHHLQKEVTIPSDLIHWLSAIGFMSILATGFPLIDLPALIRGKPPQDPEIEEDD